ncbi:GAF domain-containing sensor histidine kinase [Streptomyces sp. NPDC090026]|uniref:sensor histidine kinase n=1 Tax=Streptomyces sp. NPDC090026 TaxID=3365923 RepID=UPI0038296164
MTASARWATQGPAEPPGGPEDRVPGLLRALRSIGAGAELRPALDRICRTAAELTGARYAAIGVLDPEGGGLGDFVAHGVAPETEEAVGRPPDGRSGLLGALIHDPAPLLLDDLTADPRSVGFPPGHPSMRTFLGVPIRERGEVFGNLYLAEKHGGQGFTEEDLHLAHVLATEAGIAVGTARLYTRARRRERWIDGAVAVTTQLLAGEDADEALAVVAEQAMSLAEAAAGVVLLPERGGGLEIVAVSTPPVASAEGTGAPPGAGDWLSGAAGTPRSAQGAATRAELLGVVVPARTPAVRMLLAGETVLVADSATDPRLAGSRLAGRFGPGLLLPLSSGGRVLGALALPRAGGARRFTPEDLTLATRFAAQAALALMAAEAQRARERLAVLEDRDRIARDLHDLVIQRLFTTGMLLESAQLHSAAAGVREGVERAVGELDVTIQEIRSAVFALRQGPADEPAALGTRVLREIAMAAVPLGFAPSHRFTGPVDEGVGELTGKNLIAALREALSNAFRHARASRIEVAVDAAAQLSDGTPAVLLSVGDDGIGLPDGGRRSGLGNLARRAESLGGSSWTGPGIGTEGRGTTVFWQAPLEVPGA